MVQENSLKKPIFMVVGPTGTGKSALAVALAKKLNAEIISADSMQIYKGMDIGTAKITKQEMENIPHFMLNVVDAHDEFSVSEYAKMAQKIISDIQAKQKNVIIVGGTGFYIDSILYDMSFGDTSKNEKIRNELKALAELHGNEYVYAMLEKIDTVTAKKLHPNDIKRVIRAIEIYKITGTLKSQLGDMRKEKYDYIMIGLNYKNRVLLYDRLNFRVDNMISANLFEEINHLLSNGLTFEHQSMQGIGYKEFRNYIENNESLEDVIQEIKKNTRNYAKRQITWFRKYNNIKWYNVDEYAIQSDMYDNILNDILLEIK